MEPDEFDLRDFTPYLLPMASEATSAAFQPAYREGYGMLRTEWRVLFHLGRYGAMTARDLCDRARLHKTKVSRAVAALEAKRFLARETDAADRRRETLALTPAGRRTYRDLSDAARTFDARLLAGFAPDEARVLRAALHRLAGL